MLGRPVWVSNYRGQDDNIYLFRQLINLRNGREIGILVFNIKIDAFHDIVTGTDFGEGARITLLNEDKTIITGLDNELRGSLYDGFVDMEIDSAYMKVDNTLTVYATTKYGWKLIAAIPVESILVMYMPSDAGQGSWFWAVLWLLYSWVSLFPGHIQSFAENHGAHEYGGKRGFDR